VTSSTINVGIIGLGGAARQMLPSFLSHPNIRIRMAADPRKEARDAFELETKGIAVEDAAVLCASPLVDVVYVATPHQFHKEHTCLAARCGKHIIVEKPMALKLSDCEEMISVAEAEGVHLIVGHTHGFNAPIKKMRELIHNGAIGQVAMINSFLYGNFLYRPRRPEELMTSLGGGIIYNQAPHQVDIVRLLGGGLVRSVRAQTFVLDEQRPTEGAYTVFLSFEGGAAASLTYSGYDFFDSDEFHYWIGELGEPKASDRHAFARASLRNLGGPDNEIAQKSQAGFGGRRSLAPASGARWQQPHFGVTIVTGSKGDLRQSERGVSLYSDQGLQEISVDEPRAYPDKCGVVDEMCAAIASGQTPLHSGRWALATMEVCEAILTSAQLGREVYLEKQIAVLDA